MCQDVIVKYFRVAGMCSHWKEIFPIRLEIGNWTILCHCSYECIQFVVVVTLVHGTSITTQGIRLTCNHSFEVLCNPSNNVLSIGKSNNNNDMVTQLRQRVEKNSLYIKTTVSSVIPSLGAQTPKKSRRTNHQNNSICHVHFSNKREKCSESNRYSGAAILNL